MVLRRYVEYDKTFIDSAFHSTQTELDSTHSDTGWTQAPTFPPSINSGKERQEGAPERERRLPHRDYNVGSLLCNSNVMSSLI